jgi:PKD repeat protein
MFRKLLLIIIFLFIYGNPVLAQWINANPGAGGQLQHVVCDPNITGRMYLCSDMEGYYVSHDFGDHWIYKGWESPFSFVFNITVEPGNSNRLYLTSSQGVAVSNNAGNSWEIVDGTQNMSVATLAVNPNNKNIVAFANSWLETVIGQKQGQARIIYSTNRGESWQSSQLVAYTNNKNVYSITYHPVAGNPDVLVCIDDGIFESKDQFQSWRKISPPTNATLCQGADLTPDGNWLYAVYIRKDGKSGVYVKSYPDGEWQEPDREGHLQKLNQTHWRPEVWQGSTKNQHYVLIGVLKTGGNFSDNALNEGRFVVDGETVYGHVNQILKVAGANEPFDVGWNAYWSHCRTYDYYPANWESGYQRGIFTMCQQSTFRGDAAQPKEWIVNTSHKDNTKNSTAFYKSNGTASTWVWDIAGMENYVVMGMGDNGVTESWDGGVTWTQSYTPNFWNVDALEIVKGEKTLVLAGRTDGFGGALNENQGWLYYRELDLKNPGGGWKTAINGKDNSQLKGLNPYLNRIAAIQSDPHKPERVYIGTNDGLYLTENIFELINSNPEFYFKAISQPEIGSTLTRRIHVDPNDPDILFLRCWKGTYRIEKQENGSYHFVKLKVNGSDANLNDGWGHNGDITVWNRDSTTWLMLTRNVSPHWELWLSDNKGETFEKILDKEKAFEIRPPENNWYKTQGPVIYGGLCGIDSVLFTSVHLRGGGEGLTKGISFLKGTIQKDAGVVWEDYTGDPANGGFWFPASRSGKIWNDDKGRTAIFQATMGAGMWKRYLDEDSNPMAVIASDVYEGEVPFEVNFNALLSKPSAGADSIVSYFWEFGDGFKSNDAKVKHPYKQSKNYIVKLTVTDNLGKSASTHANIRGFETGPVADFVVSTYHGKTNNFIDFFGELSFDNSKNDSIVSYTWNFGDGTTAEGKNISHIFTGNGNFNVRLTVKNSAGKTSFVTKSIQIDLNTAASEEENPGAFKIFPNPVQSEFSVVVSQLSDLEVHNSLGQVVFAKQNIISGERIKTFGWESGIYLVSIVQNGKRFHTKLVKN